MNHNIFESIQSEEHPNMYRSFFKYTYAPVWKRFVAYFIDIVIAIVLTYLLYLLVEMLGFLIVNIRWSDLIDRNWYYFVLSEILIASWAYFTILPITSFGSTLGQLACGLRQIDKTGNTISFSKANIKFFSNIFSKIFYIGYIFVYFNNYRQTFHEMFTNTFLVER